MAAYNYVNGIAASENAYLLTTILRDEWGFDGVVVSDWYESVKSTAASVNAGLDVEMPNPRWRGERLLRAVEQGEVAESTVDASVRRLLLLLDKAGLFEHPQAQPEQAFDSQEQRILARQAAAEGIVLLKNEGKLLPLDRSHLTSIAMIGPNAKVAQIMGGGSAQVNAHYAITPFEGIAAQVGDQVSVRYEEGCTNFRLLPLLDAGQLLAGTQGANEQGFAVEYFNSSDLSGSPVQQETKSTSEITWFEDFPQGVNAQQFSVRMTARFTPAEEGSYTFGLVSAGYSRLFIDGQEVIENWTQQIPGGEYFGMGSKEVQAVISLEAGRQYLLTLEFAKAESIPVSAVRLGCLPPVPADAIERAVALAASCDVAIVCVGFGGEWQSEGFDRPDMELPGKQDECVEGLAKRLVKSLRLMHPSMPYMVDIPSSMDSRAFYEARCRVIEGAVASGKVVIVGRGAQAHLAQRRDVLHVRIVAPFEARLAYVMSREGLAREAAQARILKKDQGRARYLETFYHRHPGDPHLYDLVLNTGILDLESAAEVIAIVLERKARRLSVPLQELGPAVGLSHYPGLPEDFRPASEPQHKPH